MVPTRLKPTRHTWENKSSEATTSTLWTNTKPKSVVLELSNYLLKNLAKDGWIRCELDACLFKKWVEDPEDNDESKWKVNSEGKNARRGSWTYMLVYVDDILIASAETYATDVAEQG